MSADALREKLAALAARWNQEALSPSIDPQEAAALECCADELTRAISGVPDDGAG